MTSNIVLSNQEFNVVGGRPIRHDGADKVTGRARYSADITLPGLLHAKIVRSPHPHMLASSPLTPPEPLLCLELRPL